MFMTDKLNRQQSASQAYALTHFERKKERKKELAYYLGHICRFIMKSSFNPLWKKERKSLHII